MLKFKGKINYQVINSNKLNNKTVRTVTIADLHNYTNNKKKASRLANKINELKPNLVFIAGDIFNQGYSFLNIKKMKRLKEFLYNISDNTYVCITLGNHDLLGISSVDIILNNFYSLKDVRPGHIYPLYNDSVMFDDIEVIGYVPDTNLMNGRGLKTQINGLAHDEFINEYNMKGVKFQNNNTLNILLTHDPHLIAVSNNIGLSSLSISDGFITGHLHDGYKPMFNLINKIKLLLTGSELSIFDNDKGLVEQVKGLLDKDGNYIKGSKKILGKTGLCRGIIYFDDSAKQIIWQGKDYYKKDDKNLWVKIDNVEALKIIKNNNLHFMLISEGITPLFIPREKHATINVIDIKRLV